MLLEVLHDTHYEYETPVQVSQHQLHLSLRSTPWQQVLLEELQVSENTQLRKSRDPFGNLRHFFDVEHAHDVLSICSRGIVSTTTPHPSPHLDLELPWEAVRDRFVYRAGQADDPASDFLYASPLVPCAQAFRDYAAPSFTKDQALMAACMDLCLRIYREFRYDTKSTGIDTSASQALAARSGVCQDFTHVMVACCRSLGLPARYVSGYLLTHPPKGQARLIGADASHAWVEVYLPAADPQLGLSPGQWMGFCPTNGRTPGEDFVVLGWGRDFTDVSPVRGVVHGGGKHELRVAVTVRPLNDDLTPLEENLPITADAASSDAAAAAHTTKPVASEKTSAPHRTPK